jgi:processive 1,2-diacylglycerol beta-glucosyltransferase
MSKQERAQMIELKNKQTSATIGEITKEQLDFLIDMLEEEDIEDQDYWIDSMTLEYFQENGADPALIKLLQHAIGDGEGIEIEWTEK